MAAPAILWRYILREVAQYTLLGLSALALLLVIANLLKDIELLQIVGANFALLARLILVLLPAYLSYVISAALVCGVLLAFSRMSADGELVALRASGVSVATLLPPVLVLGLSAVAGSVWILFDLEPRSHLELKVLRRELLSTRSLIQPGKVRAMGEGRTLYVAEHGDEHCPLKGVVISDFREQDRPYYVAATCGSVIELEAEGLVALDLSVGAVHMANTGSSRYDRVQFAGSIVELNLDELDFFRKRLHHYNFGELLGSMAGSNYSRWAIRTEIHRRLSFPLSGLLLALLAVPLGVRPVLRGRSAGTVTAMAVTGLYWCAFTTAEVAAGQRIVPPWSLWLPNAAVLVAALVMLRRSSRAAS